MADREFKPLLTQGRGHVTINCSITLASGAPVFVEGDLADDDTGSYLTLADTGTGVITVTTANPYLAVVSVTGTRSMDTPSMDAGMVLGNPSQDATTKKWSFTVNTWANSAGTHSAADMTDGDMVHLSIVLRNTAVLP